MVSFLGVLLIARPSFLFGHPDIPGHPSDANHHQTQAGSADGGVGTGLGSGGFLNLTASDRVRLTAVLYAARLVIIPISVFDALLIAFSY